MTKFSAVFLALALSACGAGTPTPVTPPPIGNGGTVSSANGGTVTGPDGVQVVVPAGALSADTAITITKVSAGAVSQPDGADIVAGGDIYEIEPHDVTFKTPVTIRLPIPAGVTNPSVFASESGTGWYPHTSTVNNGFVELQRTGFSSYYWSYWSPTPTVTPGAHTDYFVYTATSGIKDNQFDGNSTTGDGSYSYIEYKSTEGTWVSHQGVPATVTFSAFRNENSANTPLPNCKNPQVYGKRRQKGAQDWVVLPAVSMTVGAKSSDAAISFTPDAPGDYALYFGLNCNGTTDAYKEIGIKVNMTVLAPARAVKGVVTGLPQGSQVNLSTNAQTVTVTSSGNANGDGFSFPTFLEKGTAYNVTVPTQPNGYACTVSNPSGTIANADVTNVAVSCEATQHSVGGKVSGLPQGTKLDLSTNGKGVSVTSSGNANGDGFSFANIQVGSAYAVTVNPNPAGYSCTVLSGSGTMGKADVTNVTVNCAPIIYTIGGTASLPNGSSGVQLTVASSKHASETIAAAASFSFATKFISGDDYTVTVSAPSSLNCTLSNPSGTISDNVSNVAVSCIAAKRTIGGTVSGLTAGVFDTAQLQLNGGESFYKRNGSFSFTTTLLDGDTYKVTIPSQGNSTCNFTGGTGTIGAETNGTPFITGTVNGDINNIVVTCTPH